LVDALTVVASECAPDLEGLVIPLLAPPTPRVKQAKVTICVRENSRMRGLAQNCAEQNEGPSAKLCRTE